MRVRDECRVLSYESPIGTPYWWKFDPEHPKLKKVFYYSKAIETWTQIIVPKEHIESYPTLKDRPSSLDERTDLITSLKDFATDVRRQSNEFKKSKKLEGFTTSDDLVLKKYRCLYVTTMVIIVWMDEFREGVFRWKDTLYPDDTNHYR